MRAEHWSTVDVYGMPLANVTEDGLVLHVERSLQRGEGGWVVTANLDVLWHFTTDRVARGVYGEADMIVADGMPLVWAAGLQGEPLQERVAGSSLCDPLLQMCARNGWGIALIGGKTGSAERVAADYAQRFPTLSVTADSALRFAVPPTQSEIDAARQLVESVDARVVLVGLGSPKQEFVIRELRRNLPTCWFMGVGGSFSFLAGDVKRAPQLMQRTGTEWMHRMAMEPRRLSKRYLLIDLPLAGRMFAHACWRRMTRRGQSAAR